MLDGLLLCLLGSLCRTKPRELTFLRVLSPEATEAEERKPSATAGRMSDLSCMGGPIAGRSRSRRAKISRSIMPNQKLGIEMLATARVMVVPSIQVSRLMAAMMPSTRPSATDTPRPAIASTTV